MTFFGMLLAQIVMVAGPALPPDAEKWVQRYDHCDHWLGEEPYDAKRRRQINKAIKSVCLGLDKQRAALIARYPGNTEVDRVTSQRPPLGT